MEERILVGLFAVIAGFAIMLLRGYFSRSASNQRNVFGRMNAERPAVSRTMPLVVGGGMVLAGVLVLFGVLGVQ